MARWSVDTRPADGGGTHERTYEWRYEGHELAWDLELPEALYEYCRRRERIGEFGVYVADPHDDGLIEELADTFAAYAEEYGLSERETVDLAVRFVQSMPYTPDSVSTGHDEYPRYPVETLVDEGGDCTDTSVLLAALLRDLGYEVGLLLLPGHMAVGVGGTSDLPGTYYEFGGTRYYYLETTGYGWDVGEMPEEYEGQRAELHRIDDDPVLVHWWTAEHANGRVTVEAGVANRGVAPARDAGFVLEFEDATGEVVARTGDHGFEIEPGFRVERTFDVRVPSGRRLRPTATVGVGEYLHDRSTGERRRV